MTDTDVQVTQADREAAAGFFSPGAPEAACLAGQFDDRPIVQALARHVQQSTAKLEADNAALRAENEGLREAAQALRTAQRNYIADRGNDALGKIVAEKAAALDTLLNKEPTT